MCLVLVGYKKVLEFGTLVALTGFYTKTYPYLNRQILIKIENKKIAYYEKCEHRKVSFGLL